ncbi:hypothetical protein EVAR_13634_1 [Eumeta japonica]|uniref:Uncharacterized protein n=1 Tax=Eumeta variegata TaxID=151549 RepID=A0A4C1UTC3_EUMVA|nr:hypothetical protein EVAR_13634_1 [Eumeta japonica]
MLYQHVSIVIGSLLCLGTTVAVPGDPVVYFPPFELRAVPPEKSPFIPGLHSDFMEPIPKRLHQKMLHNVAEAVSSSTQSNVEVQAPSVGAPLQEQVRNTNSTISIHDLLFALGIDDHEKHSNDQSHGRSATVRDYEYGGYPGYAQPPMDYTYAAPIGHEYWPPTRYIESPVAYVPPTYGHYPALTAPSKPLSIFKPLIAKVPDLPTHLKPVASKIANKIGGLIGLILSLLTGTTFENLGELKVLKDLIVNGIIKPLMEAKSSIKSLIGKLTIPVLSLLLVNLEMLVLIWWLWEDCAPQPVHEPPVYPYPKPVPYNYNIYK